MSNPVVLLLSLEKESFWDTQYSNLIDGLAAKATVKRVVKAERALSFIADTTPSAIIVTDAALTKRNPALNTLQERLVDYVKQGGTVVIATHFNSFTAPADANRWFRSVWGLPWKTGDYHRTTLHLNTEHHKYGDWGHDKLYENYSQKAVFLENVPEEAAVYLPSTTSQTESHVFAPSPVDQEQTAVAFIQVGEGYLGYVGDVNSEAGSDAVIIAMCGV